MLILNNKDCGLSFKKSYSFNWFSIQYITLTLFFCCLIQRYLISRHSTLFFFINRSRLSLVISAPYFDIEFGFCRFTNTKPAFIPIEPHLAHSDICKSDAKEKRKTRIRIILIFKFKIVERVLHA